MLPRVKLEEEGTAGSSGGPSALARSILAAAMETSGTCMSAGRPPAVCKANAAEGQAMTAEEAAYGVNGR